MEASDTRRNENLYQVCRATLRRKEENSHTKYRATGIVGLKATERRTNTTNVRVLLATVRFFNVTWK